MTQLRGKMRVTRRAEREMDWEISNFTFEQTKPGSHLEGGGDQKDRRSPFLPNHPFFLQHLQ